MAVHNRSKAVQRRERSPDNTMKTNNKAVNGKIVQKGPFERPLNAFMNGRSRLNDRERSTDKPMNVNENTVNDA